MKTDKTLDFSKRLLDNDSLIDDLLACEGNVKDITFSYHKEGDKYNRVFRGDFRTVADILNKKRSILEKGYKIECIRFGIWDIRRNVAKLER